MAISVTTDERSNTTTIKFVLPDDVHEGPVSAVGDFNSWKPGAHKLVRRRNGTRSVSVTVPRGQEIHFRYLGSGGGPHLPLVELTGGEPLLQPDSLPLMHSLCDAGYTVLLETSGALDIAPVDPRVHRIMDLKCPSSGETARNRWDNLPCLKQTDEIKFVLGTVEDYEWVKQQIASRQLAAICPLLCSWVTPLSPRQQDASLKSLPPGQTPLTRQELAERIIADALPVRFQLQMHKFIWPPDDRGV